MERFQNPGMSREDWIMSSTPTVINYNHQGQSQLTQGFPAATLLPSPMQPPIPPGNINDLVQLQLQMLKNQSLPPTNVSDVPKPQQLTSFGPLKPFLNNTSDKYNPFVEDVEEDMEISDEEKESRNVNDSVCKTKNVDSLVSQSRMIFNSDLEIKSGAAFYQGLILYIPPFEQLSQTYRGSPALKMLYASFEFSFKMPVRIETKPRDNQPNISDATVYFKDHFIATGTGVVPHVEASVRSLELLSETCYTIQAKEDYYLKCKLVDAENMKTLNLKRWEALSEKYPKIVDATKNSHIQKTFAVFLDSHTSTGVYEDIVCCNLTRQEVNNIKSVVEFFHLTMLPCSISTNLSKKHTPCVVTIQKYTSAKKLLDILIECGGENEKFKLYPPDTFKDFYKLHPNYWDPNLRNKPGNDILTTKTTLEDPILQASIIEPYKNLISELFEKHKTLPKKDKQLDDVGLRKAGDDFMKTTFQIDMTQSKNKAPVERMSLLLNYMEQLQEYGSRVLTSGRTDMIKIYHNAIDNVRKDLEECRKDIEKEQKDKEREKPEAVKSKDKSQVTRSKSPTSRKKSPSRRRSKSPTKKSHEPSKRSLSPRRRARSKSPRRPNRARQSPSRSRRSPSPRRRPRSPARRGRSKSPRRVRSPLRLSPFRKRSPKSNIEISIFKDQLKRYIDVLRRFRIEIEDTPIEWRNPLRAKMFSLRDQLKKFRHQVEDDSKDLGEFQYELEMCRDELAEQNDLINGKPGPNDLPQAAVPPLEPPPMMDFDLLPRPVLPGEPILPIPRALMGLNAPPPGTSYSPSAYRYSY